MTICADIDRRYAQMLANSAHPPALIQRMRLRLGPGAINALAADARLAGTLSMEGDVMKTYRDVRIEAVEAPGSEGVTKDRFNGWELVG